jgi:hypothetical protein
MNKRVALLLIVALAVSSLIAIKPAPAEAPIPKPSVPEFTVKFVNASYSVTTTNPYTGLSETKLKSNNSIEVTINNQPFDYSNNQIYFNVRVKPRFADNWTEVYPVQNLTSSYNGDGIFSYGEYISPDSPTQSSSSYTIITFPVIATYVYSESGDYSGYNIQRYYSGQEGQEGRYSEFLSAIPSGGQIDFQMEALVGHASQRWVIEHPLFPTYGGHSAPAIAYDSKSGWSNTQTITIATSTPSPTDSPTPDQTPTPTPDQEPQQTELLTIILAVALIMTVIGTGLLVYFKKHNRQAPKASPDKPETTQVDNK